MTEFSRLVAVSKSYVRGEGRLRVLVDVSLRVDRGEIVAVVGSRDEGKTTLLKVASGIEEADHGEVWLGDLDLTRCTDRERSRLLGDEVTWISREGPGVRLEVWDYVGLPLVMGRGRGRREVRNLATQALERVGVSGCARQRWEDLSSWERVLVALARGIVSGPRLMVIDDLLDGLGMRRTREAGELLRSVVDELGCGVLMSASDLETALIAERVWSFSRGRLTLMSDQARAEANIIDFPSDARQRRDSHGAGS